MNFTGHIEVEGKIIYKNISGEYRISTDTNGMKSWNGSLRILSGEVPDLIDGNLCMTDGRKGKIIITKIDIASGSISFQGNGPII